MALEVTWDFDSSFRSRAVSEEAEIEEDFVSYDDDDKKLAPFFRWGKIALNIMKEKNSSKLEPQLLLLGLKGSGASFLRCLCKKNALYIGTIVLPGISVKGRKVNELESTTSCRVYSLDGEQCNKIAVINNYNIESQQSWNWTFTLMNNISPLKLHILSSLSPLDYIESDIEYPLLRMLATSKAKDNQENLQCTFLQTPNLVSNVPAALLSYCEMHSIEAAIYLSLEPLDLMEKVDSIHVFERLTQSWGLPSIHLNDKEVIHSILDHSNTCSLLYA